MPNQTPSLLTCPSCGAPLDFDGKSSVVRCKFCKNVALIPGLPSAQETSPLADLEEIRTLAQAGNLVDAIHRFRAVYGVGLKEAKDAVEALAAGKVIEVHEGLSGSMPAEEIGRGLGEVQELLRSGDKIAAIKRYREITAVGLAEAKYAVDKLEAGLTRPEFPGSSIPHQQKSKQKFPFACVLVPILLVGIGVLVAFLFAGKALNPLTPNLVAIEPSILVSSTGTQMDVVSLFYNPVKDTRQIGLVDGATGTLRWQGEPLTGDGFAQGIAASGDMVYVASGNTLLATQKSDGAPAWQTQMPDKLNYGDTTIMVTGGRVITINADQSLQAYDAATGSLAWNRRLSGNDRTLRLMNGSLAVLDYTVDTYDYSIYFLDPINGSEQRIITPSCPADQFSSSTLAADSGLVYIEAENAIYVFFESYNGCVQRLNFESGQVIWQTNPQDRFSFSFYGFNWLETESVIYFNTGNQLMAVNKSDGVLQAVLTDENYDFVPLAVTGDTLLVRAHRSRGTERFELWGVNTSTGKQTWQMVLDNASPIDPPDEMIGLVDESESAWTWKLLPTGLTLIKFQAAPNQMVLDTIQPSDGTVLNEQTIPLSAVSGDFYSIPAVIGWQDNIVYLNVDGVIYVVDIATGKVLFHF